MVYFIKVMQKSTAIFLLLIVFLSVQTLDNNVYGQTNRKGKRNTFSAVGKNHTFIRHGLTIHVGGGISASLSQPLSAVPMVGIGYVASQYYGVANRFMQQSVTYLFGIGFNDGGFQTHNAIGTFHCSYIGGVDLNPFVYGIALHYAYATKNNAYPYPYSNFYIRPEIGIAFPAKYGDRTKDVQRVTAMITYGFNIRTFYNYNIDMEKWKQDPNSDLKKDEDFKRPFTAMNHHVVTVRLNINLGNIREFRR